MIKQVGFVKITLATDATHVGPLTRVQFFMLKQAAFDGKAHLTAATCIGLGNVLFHVSVQAAFFIEDYLANRAGMGRVVTSTHVNMSSLSVVLSTGQAGMKLRSKLDCFAVFGESPTWIE